MDPPPPPPHGTNTGSRGSGLPPGNYDIFIIPPHSSGSGFLYLPSLQPHRNSFLAGIGCTLLAMAIWSVVFPVLREWFATIVASGGMAVVVLLIGVGVAGWAWGKTQIEGGRPAGGGTGGAPNPQPQPHPHPRSQSNPHAHTNSHPHPHPDAPPHSSPPPPSPPPSTGEPRPPPKPTWQRASTGPFPASGNAQANGTANGGAAKGAWEKAREEFKKKEEERKRSEDLRKRAEELRKKREEEEKERAQQREKDAREREARERREKYAQERAAREKAREAAAQAAAKEAAQPAPQPPPPPMPPPAPREASRPPSPEKRHHQPTAKTATDDDAYSFRPYDKPKRPVYKTTSASSVYSESSYAPSQSTSRTTPPPSHRGPYHTKDPDKIVIKAVYSFNNTFTKLPIAQLVSGVGSVTDGLILRITTEGLFIDDDVRGVPQREWDVKAWTLKLVEVWCPNLRASSGSTPASRTAGRSGFLGSKSATKAPTIEESDLLLENLLRTCKASCFVTKSSWTSTTSSTTSSSRDRSNVSVSQSGEFKGLHVLRASIRDQEGKRYVFVLQEEEGWKIAVGLQRLRRGTQVRALAVSGMPANDARAILENMGWS